MTDLWPGCAWPEPQGSRHTGLYLLVLAFLSYSPRSSLTRRVRVLLVATLSRSPESGPSTNAVWMGAGSSHAPGYGDTFVDALVALAAVTRVIAPSISLTQPEDPETQLGERNSSH